MPPLSLLLLAVACVQPPELLSKDLEVISMYPSDGSAAVPTDINPRLVFSDEIGENIGYEVLLHRGNIVTELSCKSISDPNTLDCRLDEPLLGDAWYRLTADLGPDGDLEGEGTFTTSDPHGIAFDVGPNLTVEQLGGNDAAVTVLEDLLLSGDDHLIMVMDRFVPNQHRLPWDGDWLLGNATIRENRASGELEAVIDEDGGLTISAEGTLHEDGGFVATTDHASLPVSIDGETVALTLDDVLLAGAFDVEEGDYSAVHEVRLSSVVPERALDELAEGVPDWARVLADLTGLIDMDVDLDGDGIDDAATFELTSHGRRVLLAD